MALWSSFYPDLLPFVQGASEPVLDRELLRAAAEYFKRCRAWLVWLDPITVADAQRAYTLTLPAGSMIVRIKKATIDGARLGIQSFRQFDADPTLVADQADGLTSRTRLEILLARQAAAGSQIQLQVVLTCGEAATGIPDELFGQHVDGIVHGAKSRLMLQPDKPYTNPDLAATERGLFNAAIADAHSSAYTGDTDDVPRRPLEWC